MKKNKFLKYLLLGVIAAFVATCIFSPKGKDDSENYFPRDYAEIADEGFLRAAIEYNSISLYVDGDTLSGFHYELAEAFARDHGLEVIFTPEMGFEQRLEGLAEGKYDILACEILATREQKDSLALTVPILLNREVLIQRKAKNPQDTLFVKSLLGLAGKTVHMVKGSPSILRIQNLSNEIGDTIYVEEIDKYGTEQLISLVAHGDIDYAVCDENIARVAADSLPQIDISTAISFTQFYSWGVSKQSPALLDSLNIWLGKFKEGEEYQALRRKYKI